MRKHISLLENPYPDSKAINSVESNLKTQNDAVLTSELSKYNVFDVLNQEKLHQCS